MRGNLAVLRQVAPATQHATPWELRIRQYLVTSHDLADVQVDDDEVGERPADVEGERQPSLQLLDHLPHDPIQVWLLPHSPGPPARWLDSVAPSGAIARIQQSSEHVAHRSTWSASGGDT